MFPIDPKKMQGMMKQLGISQEEIDADRVIIEKEDGNIIIENPQVSKVMMSGQETFQISGEIKEEAEMSEEDIEQVMEKTGKNRKEVIGALQEAEGDLADAILKLS